MLISSDEVVIIIHLGRRKPSVRHRSWTSVRVVCILAGLPAAWTLNIAAPRRAAAIPGFAAVRGISWNLRCWATRGLFAFQHAQRHRAVGKAPRSAISSGDAPAFSTRLVCTSMQYGHWVTWAVAPASNSFVLTLSAPSSHHLGSEHGCPSCVGLRVSEQSQKSKVQTGPGRTCRGGGRSAPRLAYLAAAEGLLDLIDATLADQGTAQIQDAETAQALQEGQTGVADAGVVEP